METINRKDFFAILLSLSGKRADFMNIKTITTHAPRNGSTVKSRINSADKFEDVFNTSCIIKWTEMNVQYNTIYENAVNNRREKEGLERDFKSQGLKYGEFIEGSRILLKKGDGEDAKYYVRVYVIKSKLGKSVKYTKANGTPLTENEVKRFEEEFADIKPDFIKSQGLDAEDAAFPLNYGINSFREVTISGTHYQIVD